MILRKNNLRILVMEPANQQLPIDTARPNGALGPAFLVGALREAGYSADYLDATVGPEDYPLEKSFYNRIEQSNGTIRYGMSREALSEKLSKYDIIATSSIFTAQTRMHLEIAKIIRKIEKEMNKKIFLMSGGVNARALRELFLKSGYDLICLGEGEKTIVEVAQQIETNGKIDPNNIHGVALCVDGKIITKPVKNKICFKMDGYPFPDLTAFPLKKYKKIGIAHAGVLPKGYSYAPIQTSRGCQNHCSFCHISMEKKYPDLVGNIAFLRTFSHERISQEVDRAIQLGVNRLYFEDDNLFFNKKRIEELVPYLARPALEYSNVNGANLRFLFCKDSSGANVVDEHFIERLRAIGLKELVLPFESINPEILKSYASQKFNPKEMNPFALVKSLKKAGIRLSGNFMIGFRDEPWESILSTKEYAKQLVEAGLDAVGFMIPVPYPGSLDFEYYMSIPRYRESFEKDPLYYTDRMHWRALPLFPTRVPGPKLVESVKEFWKEINPKQYKDHKQSKNVMTASVN